MDEIITVQLGEYPYRTTIDRLPWLREMTEELVQGALESGLPEDEVEQVYGLKISEEVLMAENRYLATQTDSKKQS